MENNEKTILEFWSKRKIYEKSVKQNSKGKKFYFMDGPPYATGHIHMGTALNKVLKDISLRSRRLQGFDVFDRPGYDTHGLPIEFQVEKEIGSKAKKDIVKYGVKKFVSKCRSYATKYIGVMNEEFINLGVWMDWKNPYLTLSDNYIETIWDCFKKADEKGLLYLGKYPVHVCPRCETAVAYNEIEYAKQDDTSIFVKFPLKNSNNKFLIIWTTTPWTLPGNTGVMVNPNIDYQEIEYYNGEKWIIAKDLVDSIMSELPGKRKVIKTFKGKEMKGWEYDNPLKKHLNVKVENSYRVVLSSRYVTTEEGSGLVHVAPGHGKEDYEVGKKEGLDIISPVAINGLLTEETGKYKGKKARVVDEEIIHDLKKDGFLISKKKHNHDYPLCWRCNTSLLMLSLPQWFFRINDIQNKILRSNKQVNWIPKYMELRMKAWLEGISDWPISRDRYWGTPLPIWECSKCDNKKVIGSIKELEKLSKKKIIEVHKPEIDNIKLNCKCGGVMNRVPEVLDVWFDSGVASWAALDFMKNKKKFDKFWPANLNIEGKDMVRGWWNSQIILSEIKFGKKPFDNILVHGMILDLGKKKMSKSLGNIISPKEIIDKYNRDYLRYYFAKISKGEDFAFNESEFRDIGKVFRMWSNVNTFINQLSKKKNNKVIEDKWILSKFNNLVLEITKDYNNYNFPEVIRKLEVFLIQDLSRDYIKIIRERSDEVYEVLNEIRIGLVKLLAPIIPFTSEVMWQELKNKKEVKEESVHLSLLPKIDKKKIDSKLEDEFLVLMEVIEAGLRERDKAGIGLKWPLANVKIESIKLLKKNLHKIVKEQLNVKSLEVKVGKRLVVKFNTNLTPDLEAEGYARNVIRNVQGLRKKLGLIKKNHIDLVVVTDPEAILMLQDQEKFVKDKTNTKNFKTTDELLKKSGFTDEEFKIKNKGFHIFLKKVK